MMNLLPVDIQQEILSYLSHLDKLEYARCNRSLRSDLIARLRMISLQKERIAQEYLTSESFRKEILGRIVDPYHQLVLDYNFPQNHLELPENSQLIPNLVLRILSVYFKDFHRLLPCITQIQRLELEWEKGDSTPVPSISGLRELSLLYYPKSSLASLNDGVQLNKQLDVQSLRYLKIQGGRWFSDVSCLGHIYELHLISCSALVDISCLNHNKIIVVDSCPVVDYSQSFRFSRDITINIFRRSNILTIKGINLDKLEEVHSLTMEIDYMDVTEVLFYTRSLPPSLRVLSLKKTITRFPIPPYHNLKEISFSECREVSLQNLEKIRVVKIDQCHGITDWSPLQGNQNVEISYCRGFTSSKQLSNVKILKLIKNTLMKMEDLNNITHLKLQNLQFDGSPSYFSSSAQGKRLFSSAISLQEIEWRLELKDRISFLYLIMKCPHHKRIVIDHRVSGASLMSFYQRMVKDVGKLYQVEIKPPNKVVLLKREQEKKNGGYSLLGVLLRLLIISNEDDR